MINLAQILTGKPYLITQNIYFYQPTIYEIVWEGYWSLLTWGKRKDMRDVKLKRWKILNYGKPFSFQHHRKALILSCANLLKEKVEFFDISGTIYIGESVWYNTRQYFLLADERSLFTYDAGYQCFGRRPTIS